MAPRTAPGAVYVEGLLPFRRALRQTDREANIEVRRVIKGAAEIVAREAAAKAPERSGVMAGAYRATVVGSKGIVRNPVFYSRFIEFGFHPGGGSTRVPGRELISHAIERQQAAVYYALNDGIDRAARRAGWR